MRISVVLVAALVASPGLFAAEKSGYQTGESIAAFEVADVTGKYSPQTVCYI